MRWTYSLGLALCLASPAYAGDEPEKTAQGGDALRAAYEKRAQGAADRRVMRLAIGDVGRLALRNNPRYRMRTLDPTIARTLEAETWAEFDTLFAANAAFGRDRSPIFFNPSAMGGPGAPAELERNLVTGGTGIGQKQTWGGEFSLGYDLSSTSERGGTSISSLSPRYEGVLSLAYAHPLLRGGGEDVTLSFTREAQEQVLASDSALLREAETTVAGAESSYWLLVGAIADRMVRAKSLEVAEELLSISDARLRSGRGIRVEVTEARAGVESRKVDLIQADTVVENQTDRLRESIVPFTSERGGSSLELELLLVPQDIPGLDVSDLPAEPGSEELTQALTGRADIRAAQSGVDAAEIAEERAQDDTLAQLDAVTGGSLRGLGSGFSDASKTIWERRVYAWEVGLAYSIPLGNELAEARHRRAKAVTMRATRNLRALQNSAVREIRVAARNVISTARQIEAAVRSREATEEQLEAEQARLANGIVTPFDVLQVEEDLSEARVREIRARVEYEIARVSLELARGTILETRQLTHVVEPE